MREFFSLFAHVIKKFVTTFFILLIILFLHAFIGMYLMAGMSKKTRIVPQALKVRFLTTIAPVKEKLPVSPLPTVIPSVKEKLPVLSVPKTAKKPVFPKKNPVHLKHPSSMQNKPIHLNKKEPIAEIRSVKKTMSRKTKDKARSQSFSNKPYQFPSDHSFTPLNAKVPQVIHPVDKNSSATIKSLYSSSRPDSNRHQSSPSVFTESPHSSSSSSSFPSTTKAHSNTKHSWVPPKSVPPSSKVTYLYNPRPDYPMLAKRRGQEGKVILKVKVSRSGQAENVQVNQSSGYPMLDEAALKTVQQWGFAPATQAGQAIEAWIHVPIVFQIK